MPEAAALQEAHAPGALCGACCRLAVLARENRARALEIGIAGGGRQSRRRVRGYAFRDQVEPDASGTVLARKLASALLGVAFVRELLFRGKRVEKLLERFAAFGVCGEFARQFGAGMLAAREQP